MHIFVHNLYNAGTVSVSTSSPCDTTILEYCIYIVYVYFIISLQISSQDKYNFIGWLAQHHRQRQHSIFSILQLKIEKLRE